MERFRAVFKQVREEKDLSQPRLADLTKDATGSAIGSQAVSDIETGATKDPGISTVARLVVAMGVPLSSFFAQIEGQTDGDLLSQEIKSRTAPSLDEGSADARRRSGLPLSAPALLAAGDAFVEAGTRLIAAASGIDVERRPRAAARVRGKKPGKGKRRRATR